MRIGRVKHEKWQQILTGQNEWTKINTWINKKGSTKNTCKKKGTNSLPTTSHTRGKELENKKLKERCEEKRNKKNTLKMCPKKKMMPQKKSRK